MYLYISVKGPKPGAPSYLSDLAGPVQFSPISKFRVNSLRNHLHAGSVKYSMIGLKIHTHTVKSTKATHGAFKFVVPPCLVKEKV
jgi:hypothetical protein